jgi:phosphoglucosamine mutase
MGKRLFGTDGIRGVAGSYPLDPATVRALGIALADELRRQDRGHEAVLLGMDTRESGPAIAAQLASGLAHRQIEVAFAGVVTTPGVAYLTRTGDFAAGVMISASHNPFEDNGIKVFAKSGYKLPDDEEEAIEEEIFRILPGVRAAVQDEESYEKPQPLAETYSSRRYIDFLLSTLSTLFCGQKIVLDCGNGAASALAPELFREAGADVTAICNGPNGRNINLNCGALHLENLRRQVVAEGADAGVAFDGDADRALLVAPSGRIVDGDAILLIAARRLQADGHLPGSLVVSTVMSNLGLEKALAAHGIQMLRTAVGDKYVLEEMIRKGAPLGGEQSGHIIFHEYSTTGDGMLTALKVLETAQRESATLDQLAEEMVVYPQTLVNVRVKEKKPLEEMPRVRAEIDACERELAESGRVLVRFSGTEPLLRVMVEGAEQGQIEGMAERIVGAIRAELG